MTAPGIILHQVIIMASLPISMRLYLEACKANDGITGIDMMVVILSGLEIKGAGQLAPKTTHIMSVLNNTKIMQRYTQRL